MRQEEIRAKKKIVLMALAKSGRNTLCKKFLNERWVPPKDAPYVATIDYEIHKRIIHGTEFTFFNLGGQTAFLNRFIGPISKHIFEKIDTLVFIVDVIEISAIKRAKYYFDKALEQVAIYNPKASVFLLLNRMDLIPRSIKDKVCQTHKEYLLKNITRKINIFETSIFDNSSTKAIEAVYRANLQIFEEVIPTEIEEIKEEEEKEEEEDEMLASSIREAMDILANDKEEYVPPDPILEPFGKFCFKFCLDAGFSQCHNRLHWRTVQQWRIRGFV